MVCCCGLALIGSVLKLAFIVLILRDTRRLVIQKLGIEMRQTLPLLEVIEPEHSEPKKAKLCVLLEQHELDRLLFGSTSRNLNVFKTEAIRVFLVMCCFCLID